MDKKTQESILRIAYLESKINSIENKIDKLLSILEEGVTETVKPKKISRSKNTSKKKIIKTGNCSLTLYKDALLIGGNTFDRKELIKSFGSRWNPDYKGWTVSSSKLDNVKEQLELYFESVKFDDSKKNTKLLSSGKNDSDEDLSFTSGGGCDIDSDSD